MINNWVKVKNGLPTNGKFVRVRFAPDTKPGGSALVDKVIQFDIKKGMPKLQGRAVIEWQYV